MSIEDYLAFYRELVAEMFRVLKLSGRNRGLVILIARAYDTFNGDRFMGPRD